MRLFCCCGLIRLSSLWKFEKLLADGGAHASCRFGVSPVFARIDCVGATCHPARLRITCQTIPARSLASIAQGADVSKEPESLEHCLLRLVRLRKP
jgi:hypothetical protein